MSKKDKDQKKPSKSEGEFDINDVVDEIHEEHGKESLHVGLNSGIVKCEVIPTGVISLDRALGVGGFPKGRVVEVYGPESSGKTTIALTVVASAQKLGGVAAYIDTENALDPEYAKDLGVDIDNLLFSQPDSGEEAFKICEKLVLSKKVDVVVIDSVAALVPQKELEGEIGDNHIGLQARLMSQGLRKLCGLLRKSQVCLIFINQIRDKIGGMVPGAESTPGGRALKFYASIRIDIRRIGSTKEGEKIVANNVRVKIAKNKVAPPFKLANFDITFGVGCNKMADIINTGVEFKFITKSGSNYAYEGQKMGNSLKSATDWMNNNPETAKQIEMLLRDVIFSKSNTGESSEVVEGEVTASEDEEVSEE